MHEMIFPRGRRNNPFDRYMFLTIDCLRVELIERLTGVRIFRAFPQYYVDIKFSRVLNYTDDCHFD